MKGNIYILNIFGFRFKIFINHVNFFFGVSPGNCLTLLAIYLNKNRITICSSFIYNPLIWTWLKIGRSTSQMLSTRDSVSSKLVLIPYQSTAFTLKAPNLEFTQLYKQVSSKFNAGGQPCDELATHSGAVDWNTTNFRTTVTVHFCFPEHNYICVFSFRRGSAVADLYKTSYSCLANPYNTVGRIGVQT